MSRGAFTGGGGPGAATSRRTHGGPAVFQNEFKKSPTLNREFEADAIEAGDEAQNIWRSFNRRTRMYSIFYIIGVIVVVVAVLGYLHVI